MVAFQPLCDPPSSTGSESVLEVVVVVRLPEDGELPRLIDSECTELEQELEPVVPKPPPVLSKPSG